MAHQGLTFEDILQKMQATDPDMTAGELQTTLDELVQMGYISVTCETAQRTLGFLPRESITALNPPLSTVPQ